MVRVAAVQVRVDDAEPVAERIPRVADWVGQQLAGQSVDVAVLPELWGPGAFSLDRVLSAAEPLDGPFMQRMSALAAELGVLLHAGSFPELHERGVSNTSVVFAADGTRLAVYRKIHLFGFDVGEAVTLIGGEEQVVLPTSLGPTGLATCYDLRFPELFRLLTEQGAAAFLVPAGWPQARIGHWEVLAAARAVENQAAVVAANAVGVSGDVAMGGTSMIISGMGDELARASADQQEVLVADLDPAAVARWRETFPALRDRRLP